MDEESISQRASVTPHLCRSNLVWENKHHFDVELELVSDCPYQSLSPSNLLSDLASHLTTNQWFNRDAFWYLVLIVLSFLRKTNAVEQE